MRRLNWQAGKTLVPLLGTFTAIAVGVAVIAIVLQVQERGKRLAKERELQHALIENEDLTARLQETERTKAKIEANLAHTRNELAQSAAELAQALDAQVKLSKAVENREVEIGRLTSDLTQARDDMKQLSGQLAQLQAERDTAKQQLVDAEEAKGELESKVMELSNERPTVELEKILVSGDHVRGGQTIFAGGKVSTDGQVVVVNREYDFIVMNLGRNHGLAIGQEFQVFRNDEVMGRVKVEKVYDELSAAAIVQETQPDTIREGDLVRAL